MFAGAIERFREATVATAASDIQEFQVRLGRLNLYAGAADGNFGELTRAAIKAYERSLGLPETGMPTAEIARRLQDAPPLPERKPVTAAAPGAL
jgi:localization factor PodJL